MRLCQIDGGGVGVIEGDVMRDVSSILDRLPSHRYPGMRGDALIAALPDLRNEIEAIAIDAPRIPIGSVRLASPVANPGKLIAAPVNYQAHLDEAIEDTETFSRAHVRRIEETGLFLKATSSLTGASGPIRLAFPERRTDHEIELAVVIGRKCRDVATHEALSVVAGYCIGLDITIRGPEERSMRKSIDSYSVLGPWLVTPDELGSPEGLALSLNVNGEPRQRANTRDLILNVPSLIAMASRWYTLEPGDVIFTGTPEGVGPLQPGDRLHATIDGLGALDMRIEAA